MWRSCKAQLPLRGDASGLIGSSRRHYAQSFRPFQAPKRARESKNTYLPINWRSAANATVARSAATAEPTSTTDADAVYNALRRIMDPDFGKDIVACGFVKDLVIDRAAGRVDFRLELTTPACPIKDEFKQQAQQFVKELGWVQDVNVTLDAAPQRAGLVADSARPMGLRNVRHIIAVSSCKGGVGKSTVSVNLAYTLAQMGAKVGIFDADVYGPSLPLMVSPDVPIIKADPVTNTLKPTEYAGVKLVSFGFAGQGSAIMRGPMVSGLIQQLLLTAEWGELDYLVIDFPPGTGDIQLTLCQSMALTAAVVVTTPQKLAFVDVAKGIRMFAKLAVPCVAVVENMSFFEGDGKRYFPFGKGAGERIQRDFGLPNLVRLPIVPDLSAAGDGGEPLVVSDPAGVVASSFMELGAVVVREVARMSNAPRSAVSYDSQLRLMNVSLPGEDAFWLQPAVVRRNDTSALSINEWTGMRMLRDEDIADDIQPETITPLGNYAVQINWQGGFNQVAPYDLLRTLRHLATEPAVQLAGQTLLVPAI